MKLSVQQIIKKQEWQESNLRQPLYKNGPITTWVHSHIKCICLTDTIRREGVSALLHKIAVCLRCLTRPLSLWRSFGNRCDNTYPWLCLAHWWGIQGVTLNASYLNFFSNEKSEKYRTPFVCPLAGGTIRKRIVLFLPISSIGTSATQSRV